MLCRGCKSDSHLIRDCPKMKKAALVNIILESVIPWDAFDSAYSLSIKKIVDVAQDLPDEVWFAISKDVMEEEEGTPANHNACRQPR